MTLTLKAKTEITVPPSIRRKAGIKPGDRVEFSVSGRVIKITPKVPASELEDRAEIQDPRVREHIRKSTQDYKTGRSRPAKDFVADLAKAQSKPPEQFQVGSPIARTLCASAVPP